MMTQARVHSDRPVHPDRPAGAETPAQGWPEPAPQAPADGAADPRASWQGYRKQRTRHKLLAAARGLFAEKGYEATTTREISRRAGVGVGTLFAHFPGKADLAAALLHDRLDQALEAARAVGRGGRAALALDELLDIADCLYAAYAEHGDLARVMMGAALFGEGAERQHFKRQFHELMALVAERLEAARDRGELRPDFDCRVGAKGFYADYFLILIANIQTRSLYRNLMRQQLALLTGQRFDLATPA